MLFRRWAVLIVVLASLSLAAPSSMAQSDTTDLEEIRFFLSFVPNVQFSPLYVAEANGYFAEAGLTVRIEQGDENLGVEQIAVGDIPFGMISGEQVILARANGRPVVFVYQWFQNFPIAVVIPSTTEATTVNDLAGLRVGVPGRFGATYSGIIALLGIHDMQETDIQLEVIGFNAPDVVCMGAIDASVVYINNEPLQIQKRAEAGECGAITGVEVIKVSDYANLISNGIVTNETMLTESPERVLTMNQIFDQGLRDVIQNPAEAYLVSLDFVENLPITDEFKAALEVAATDQADFLATAPDTEAIIASRAALREALGEQFSPDLLMQFDVLLASIEQWEADTLGLTHADGWELTQEVLIELGALSEKIDLSAAFTNDYLPTPAAETAE